MPALADEMKDLVKKYAGAIDVGFPVDPRAAEAGWSTTVAGFFVKRKATAFSKAVSIVEGVGSVAKKVRDTVYDPLDVETYTPGKNGSFRVIPRGKKRAMTFEPIHKQGLYWFGTIGKTSPRSFWFDESLLTAPTVLTQAGELETAPIPLPILN